MKPHPATAKSDLKRAMTDLQKQVGSRLNELQAAALCFSAAASKEYTDSRRALLRRRAHQRLLVAARDYHSSIMAISFLS